MWPYVIESPLRIGTYGVMMAIGFLTALWLLTREHIRRNIDPKHAETTVFLAIIFGVVGAKLAYMFTEADSVSWKDFFSGAGLTWHGGLILAIVAIVTYYIVKKLPLAIMFDALAPMLATGYAFGRIGCQLSGDGDYGVPCGDLVNRAQCWLVGMYEKGFEVCLTHKYPTFCMSYPDGIVPTNQLVFPTPVYESLMNFALFGLLWSIRKRIRHPGVLFSIYLICAGIMRFAIEFIRQDEGRPYRFWDLRDAHLVALASVAVGIGLWVFAMVRKIPKGMEYGILPKPAPAKAGKSKKR
ncbi:MAG: prolipoprotein diacylglyceryl transferase [Deltaproteobacteria bacterium]|nr:prolipoprotein diacylglyceryl transferase [Deltaproteobacteria bacterium]